MSNADVTPVYADSLPRGEPGRRLAELMGDDPFGEVGSVSPEAAEAAAAVLNLVINANAPVPAIFPGEEGAVQLVWTQGDRRSTVEVIGADEISGRILDSERRSRRTFEWSSVEELSDSLSEFWGGSR